jgi:hypothetical protein
LLERSDWLARPAGPSGSAPAAISTETHKGNELVGLVNDELHGIISARQRVRQWLVGGTAPHRRVVDFPFPFVCHAVRLKGEKTSNLQDLPTVQALNQANCSMANMKI